MVGANISYAQKSIWANPMELQDVVGQVESFFYRFGDDVSVSARKVHGLRQTTIGFEIILDAPDGTLRG
jgi:hypothetical protein